MLQRSSDLYFGASVVGPRHQAQRRPNEDCWLGARGAFGTLVVVSDGMGSRSDARKGSRMACRAVLTAVRAWHKSGVADPDAILDRIQPLWLELIAPSSPGDCAATCLFALSDSDGKVHIAAIGDGLALLRTAGGLKWVVGPRAEGFSNETDALGLMSSWNLRTFTFKSGDVAVLATDGVADDLVPDRIDDFVQWLMNDFAPMQPILRWRALQRELKHWPTPLHSDDKTLVVLASRKGDPT